MATPRIPDVLVLGAGVTGLTTAIRLAEHGLAVRVVASQPPQRTTSSVAGASWSPFMMNDARMLRWSEQTRSILEEISRVAGSGVRMLNGMEADFAVAEPPDWAKGVQDYRKCDSAELPAGYLSGWTYTIPIIDMPTYLGHLTERLRLAGVEVQVLPRPLRTLDELAGSAGVLVNCTGLGSQALVPDPLLDPIRGQLVVVRNPGVEWVEWFFMDAADEGDLTYFLPHGDHVVLGGSALQGRLDTVPDPDIAAGIVARCSAVEPMFRDAEIVRHTVGLRPNREGGVRVEEAVVAGQRVVHNYGHGGSGVTMSWGCAGSVLDLVLAGADLDSAGEPAI